MAEKSIHYAVRLVGQVVPTSFFESREEANAFALEHNIELEDKGGALLSVIYTREQLDQLIAALERRRERLAEGIEFLKGQIDD